MLRSLTSSLSKRRRYGGDGAITSISSIASSSSSRSRSSTCFVVRRRQHLLVGCCDGCITQQHARLLMIQPYYYQQASSSSSLHHRFLCSGRVNSRRNVVSTTTAALRQRRFSSSSSSSGVLKEQQQAVTTKSSQQQLQLQQHEPPLAVRVALVSSTTALCTPAFPVIGFVNAIIRFSITNADVRRVAVARSSTILSFATWTLLPAFYHIAPLLLPFAVGNGVVAGASYAAWETAVLGTAGSSSSSKLLAYRNHFLVGAGIGTITAYVAPMYAYGPAFSALYGVTDLTESFQNVMALPFVTPITLATGFVAGGLVLHPVLQIPLQGIAGVHWKYVAGTLLGVSAAALWYLYTPDERLVVPDGSYVEPAQRQLLEQASPVLLRYNVTTGQAASFARGTNQWVGPAAVASELRQLIVPAVEEYDKPAVDDRLLAWMAAYWDAAAVTNRYPHRMVHIDTLMSTKSKRQLHQLEQHQLETDAVVALILDRQSSTTSAWGDDADGTTTNTTTRENLLTFLDELDQLQRQESTTTSRRQKQHEKTLDSLQAISHAVELLMALRMMASGDNQNTVKREDLDRMQKQLETYIRQRYPGLDLFAVTQNDDKQQAAASGDKSNNSSSSSSSSSVEYQLQKASWSCPNVDKVQRTYEKQARQEQNWQYYRRSGGILLLSVIGLLLATTTGPS